MNSIISSIVTSINSHRSMAAPNLPLDTSPFTLGTSGVAGVIGGDEAVSAMAIVHVYQNRRWLGWYNSPGSYQIAKRLSLLAKSRIPEGFFPGIHTDPAKLVDLDVTKGPKFRATHSGTVIENTGNLASLVMKECSALDGKLIEGRKTQAVGVTIVKLDHIPEPRMYPRCINPSTPILASIPIFVSLASCVTCGIFEDWYALWLILLGVLANGASSLAIGSGKLQFMHPVPAAGSPPGDGILGSGKDLVLLKGAEGAVNSITRGSFSLSFSGDAQLRSIKWCSALLTVQFIAQLLLIPQASLFGQILFVTSLGVSWIYNSWLASLDKDKIQRDILFDDVLGKPSVTKYTLGTFTTTVIFALLILQPQEPLKFLDELLPNDTKVWRQWKRTIVRRLDSKEKLEFAVSDWEVEELSTQERSLLETLYGDAQAAYNGYTKYVASN